MKTLSINGVNFSLTNIANAWAEKGEKKFKDYAEKTFWLDREIEDRKRYVDELWLEVVAVAPKKK